MHDLKKIFFKSTTKKRIKQLVACQTYDAIKIKLQQPTIILID